MDPLGITKSAATVNGRGCVATPKIVGPEGVILAGFRQNPGLRFLGFLTNEAEAMAEKHPRMDRTLCMDPLWITEVSTTVNGHGHVATPKIVGSEGVIMAKIQV